MIFIIAGSFSVLLIIYFFLKSRNRGVLYYILLALISAGGVGNIYDRVCYGKVRDFIQIGIKIGGHYIWPYIFNLADVFIVIGVIGITIRWVFYDKFDQSENEDVV